MNTGDKARIVNEMKDKFGLNRSLSILGLPKSSWYYQKRKADYGGKYRRAKEDLLKAIKENSAYGYKRLTFELNESYGYQLNKKTVLKLLKNHSLTLARKVKRIKPSFMAQTLFALGEKMNIVGQIMAEGKKIEPFEVCYTDFTELVYDYGQKKAQLMPIIEHAGKLALGWEVGNSADTKTALQAWSMAIKSLKKLFLPAEGLVIHHDRGSVYIGYQWLKQILIKDKALVSYALRGFKDNPEMESFNGRFKDENQCLVWECETLEEVKSLVDEKMLYYNNKRRHSSLGNISPIAYLKIWQKHRRF